MSKKKVIKDYNQMPGDLLLQLKNLYPQGYGDHLLRFTNTRGEIFSAIPFETEDIYYLIRMNDNGGYHIVEDEEDPADDFNDLSGAEELDLDDSEE